MKCFLAAICVVFATSAVANVDLPLPQTYLQSKFILPEPYKEACVIASGIYIKKDDELVLKALQVDIGSVKTNISERILKLFRGPRLDTFRLFVSPGIQLSPDEPEHLSFAATFRFSAYASSTDDLDERPTAWIGIKDGKVSEIWVIEDIKKGTIPSQEFDLETLQPVKTEQGAAANP